MKFMKFILPQRQVSDNSQQQHQNSALYPVNNYVVFRTSCWLLVIC